MWTALAGCAILRSQSKLVSTLQGPGKKWEHLEVNKNGKPVRVSMHVRLGDTVKVGLAWLNLFVTSLQPLHAHIYPRMHRCDTFNGCTC
jgi:hypothetical protein